MSVDQQVRDAGTRLGELPVEVPDLDVLVQHRHRRRSAAMSGAIVLLLVVVVGSALVVREPADQSPASQGDSPADRGPVDQGEAVVVMRQVVTDEPIGLNEVDGLWPAAEWPAAEWLGRSAEAVAGHFASDVLGWPEADIGIGTGGLTGRASVRIQSGDESVNAQVEEIDGAWRLTSIGDMIGLMEEAGSAVLTVDPRPEGTVAMRSWTVIDGTERVTTYNDPSSMLLIDAPIDLVSAAIVVFLDADGRAIGASGGSLQFVDRPPQPDPIDMATYRLAVEDARLARDGISSPTTLDGAVWVSEDRQTYLTLTVRPGAGWVGPTYDGPLTEDADFPADEGRAWFTTDDGEPVRSLEMWWNRPSGELRMVSMHWPHVADGVQYAEAHQQLRDWASKIGAGETHDGYSLAVVGAERLAISEHGLISHRARVWEHPEGEIVLTTTDSVASGLSNALRRESTTIVVDDTKGWISVDPLGLEPARVAWERDDLWFTLHIPHALAGDIDAIIATLERE